ncbi:MAG TPA: hypothetical protein VFG39_05345 [Balneolaceae bacterium]|nr:hypothetical protein [Balneolaceae bacterium]
MKSLNKIYQSPIAGAVGLGLIWAIGWGLGIGGLMEAFFGPGGEILDMWPQTLGIPGFLGGVIFYAVLRIAEGPRNFGELPLTRTGIWGAVSGLLLGMLLIALFRELWQLITVIFCSAILMSTIAAIVSALLFRYVAQKQSSAGEVPGN